MVKLVRILRVANGLKPDWGSVAVGDSRGCLPQNCLLLGNVCNLWCINQEDWFIKLILTCFEYASVGHLRSQMIIPACFLPIPMYFFKDTGRLDRYDVEVEGFGCLKYLFEVEMYLPSVCLYWYETVNRWR